MGTIVQSFFPLHCSSNSRRNYKIQKRKNTFQNHPNQINQIYPKSSPTPLLINKNQQTQTKIQALTAIVEDLEASIDKGLEIETQIFASLLETCYGLQALDHGIRIHRIIPPNLLRKNHGLSSKLLRLYASNRRVEIAHKVFDEMVRRDESAFAWNSLISGYVELGCYEDGMAIYYQMVEEGVEPDRFTFPRVLKACSGIGSIRVGEDVHRNVIRCGFGCDGFVNNALVDMYAKCGDIVRARKTFNKISLKDLVSWNSMLTAYIYHGLLVEGLDTFRQMIRGGYEPDSITISSIVSGVSSLKVGHEIHAWIVRRGLEWSISIVNALIIVYANHGMLNKARSMFSQMPERDVVSWNSIIAAHSKHHEALTYFEQMEHAFVMPDTITFVSLLSSCAYLGLVEKGETLFTKMKQRYSINPGMEHYACMVNLYGRAGLVEKAYKMVTSGMEFEAGPTVWGALLYGCYLHGNVEIAETVAEKLFDLEPDNELNFELLMNVYRKVGRSEDADRVKEMMAERGLDFVN